MRRMMVALTLAGSLLAACGGDDSDAGGQLACGKFHTVAADVTDGQLTPSELRSELQEVRDRAAGSTDPEIVTAGRDMVEAATDGDDDRLADAVNRFGQACEAGGF